MIPTKTVLRRKYDTMPLHFHEQDQKIIVYLGFFIFDYSNFKKGHSCINVMCRKKRRVEMSSVKCKVAKWRLQLSIFILESVERPNWDTLARTVPNSQVPERLIFISPRKKRKFCSSCLSQLFGFEDFRQRAFRKKNH